MIINYKQVINKLNLEALKYAPDGNVFTGYQILNNKKILYKHDKNQKIYIILSLKSELEIDLEIITNSTKRTIKNVKEDINLNSV